ncbi:universal stress protein [Catenulispora sp. NF23]|uniref:Universal stress protein n=1 Tax=Catenulispora pinistramenti TaxID=2705254 RepID=A0ABS5KQG8_9ACTN|nr:universal stress protein [Catenulispora pinistramenti]MBS2531726.1 universal stress protein [Catenulispora pinistramenti]MBS2548293.1 universal stress protein [Catenulispora pinistramenti]
MPNQTTDREPRIVVGVDGSPCSKTALLWAMNQARQTGADVEAVAAWQFPTMYGAGFGYAYPSSTFDGVSAAADAQKALDETVSEVCAEVDQPVKVRTRVAEGHPAEVLITAATGARMLVVGTRGHGSFAGILLGSVSQHCVQHAPCPVLVVPPAVETAASQIPNTDEAWSQS